MGQGQLTHCCTTTLTGTGLPCSVSSGAPGRAAAPSVQPGSEQGPDASWLLRFCLNLRPSHHSTPSWPQMTCLLLQSNAQVSCKFLKTNPCSEVPLRFPQTAEVTQHRPTCDLRGRSCWRERCACPSSHTGSCHPHRVSQDSPFSVSQMRNQHSQKLNSSPKPQNPRHGQGWLYLSLLSPSTLSRLHFLHHFVLKMHCSLFGWCPPVMTFTQKTHNLASPAEPYLCTSLGMYGAPIWMVLSFFRTPLSNNFKWCQRWNPSERNSGKPNFIFLAPRYQQPREFPISEFFKHTEKYLLTA